MKEYQERVVKESEDLIRLITRLDALIDSDAYHDIDKAEQERLVSQLEAMELYASVLRRRIHAFKESFTG